MAQVKESSGSELRRYRWQVFGRIVLATLGGYAFTLLLGILLTYSLPVSKSSAVMTANLLSFAIYTSVVIWVFSARSLRSIAINLGASIVLLGLVTVLFHVVSGG
ncbi:MAG TPA: DUF3649 domain-containing protein [Cellvibrio sp.]